MHPSRTLSLFVFIDALGWRISNRYPMLRDVLTQRVSVDTVLGYSSTCIPTIPVRAPALIIRTTLAFQPLLYRVPLLCVPCDQDPAAQLLGQKACVRGSPIHLI